MPDDTATRLDDLASGYQGAAVLFAAVRLDLFNRLADAPRSAQDLAGDLEADPRGVRILLDACAALGLLDKAGDTFRPSEIARAHLLSHSPRPRGARLRHGVRQYQRWGRLVDSVMSGEPVPDEVLEEAMPHHGVPHDAAAFARAMADVGRESADKTWDALEAAGELDGVKTALDVGGGPGIYAIDLARRLPGARVTVMDRAETLEVAREYVSEASLGDRITLLAGDAFTDPMGGPYDLVLASNLVHIFAPEDAARLVARAAATLAPGGRLVVKDFLLDDDRTAPVGGALFAVNMLVATEGGDAYTAETVGGWMEAAGLEVAGLHDLTAQSRLLVARNPA